MPNSRSKPRTDIDSGGAGLLPAAAQPVQPLDRPLLRRLDRDFVYFRVTVGLQQGFAIGSVGLVATTVWAHVVCRQHPYRMTGRRGLARPVVRAAAGFHHHRRHRPVRQPFSKGQAAQTLPANDPMIGIRHGHFDRVFCQVDGDSRRLHFRLLPLVG